MRDAPAASAPNKRRWNHANRITPTEQGHGDAVEAVADAESGRVIEFSATTSSAPAMPARPPEMVIVSTIVRPMAMPA